MATYSFNGMDLRVVEIDGEPWFIAKDVCMVLFDPKRIARQGTAAYVRSLADDQKQNLTGGQLRNLTGDKVRFHNRGLNLISESGLYKLVMRSDKKEAKQFQDWITREVLPSIRKTGTYTMPGA